MDKFSMGENPNDKKANMFSMGENPNDKKPMMFSMGENPNDKKASMFSMGENPADMGFSMGDTNQRMTKDPNPPPMMFSMGENPNDNKPRQMPGFGMGMGMGMGGPPMMFMGMGGGMGGPVELPGAENINKEPAFVQSKQDQYKASIGIINESVKDPFNERVYGCLMGAIVGDACGAFLEFYGGTEDDMMQLPSDEHLDEAMTMPGGGYHKTAAGQVTDDCEMMQCLLWAYADSNTDGADPKKLDLNKVAERYGDWYNSDPFDIGIATESAIKALAFNSIAYNGISRARQFNHSTKSNGSLMRSMPHAVFGANMVKAEKFQEFKDLISIEASFVHANPIVHEANFVYLTALAHILNNPTAADRGQAAFDLAYKLAKSDLCKSVDENYGEKVEWWMDEAKDWADAAKAAMQQGQKAPLLKGVQIPAKMWNKFGGDFKVNGQKKINLIKMQGFMKWAFCLTFYYLQMASEYELNYKDCIKEILSLGGDTDTNACIAGAAVGAMVGFNKLDSAMVQKVLECDVTGEGQKRPEWLSVGKHAIKNIEALIQVRAGDNCVIQNHPDK